jgi:hypothetical protein
MQLHHIVTHLFLLCQLELQPFVRFQHRCMIPESNSLSSWLPEPLSFYLSIDLSFTKLTIKCTLYSIKGSVKKRASTLSIKTRDPIFLSSNYSTKHTNYCQAEEAHHYCSKTLSISVLNYCKELEVLPSFTEQG